jgi:hypothetical protein
MTRCETRFSKNEKKAGCNYCSRLFLLPRKSKDKIEKPPRFRKSGFPVFGFNYSSYERNCNRNSAELRKSGFPVFTSFSATARRINLLQAPAFFNRSQTLAPLKGLLSRKLTGLPASSSNEHFFGLSRRRKAAVSVLIFQMIL